MASDPNEKAHKESPKYLGNSLPDCFFPEIRDPELTFYAHHFWILFLCCHLLYTFHWRDRIAVPICIKLHYFAI